MRGPIIAIVVLCLIVAAAYWQGGKKNRLQDEINNRDTLERMNDATNDNLDAADVIDSLRDLAE